MRRLALPWILVLALGVPGVSAQAPAPQTPLHLLVEQVLALFPKVEGDVIEVKDSRVTVTLGRRDGMQPGIDLSIYREGRELKHPRTGQILGRAEEPLGRLLLTEVFEAYSVGQTSTGAAVRPGDRVRISSGPIPLTVVALAEQVKPSIVEGAVRELFEALNRTGRFRVTLGDQVTVALAEENVRPEEFLSGKGVTAVARRFRLEHILAIHFKMVERKPYMDVRVFAPPHQSPLLVTAMFVPPSVRVQTDSRFSGGQKEPAKQAKGKERSLLSKLLTGDWEPTTYSSGESTIPLREIARFPFPARLIDVAVAPKDGIPRLVVSDGARVFQYRLSNLALEPEWTYSVTTFGVMVSLQLADLDGDGELEVVVNHHQPAGQHSGMGSFILTSKGGRPTLLARDITDILLAVDETGAGVKRTLWAQKYHREKFFAAGSAERVVVKDGKLKSAGLVRVPETFRATGATFSSISGKGSPRVLAYIDEHNRMRMAREREELWRSASSVGGGGVVVELADLRGGPRPGPSAFYRMEPIPLSVDLDGDGVDEIVVPQNLTEGMLAVVYRGPAGFRIQSINSGFEGTITGLGAVPGGDGPALVASVVRFTNALRTAGETQIIVTVAEE
jgi:hypothetical protein